MTKSNNVIEKTDTVRSQNDAGASHSMLPRVNTNSTVHSNQSQIPPPFHSPHSSRTTATKTPTSAGKNTQDPRVRRPEYRFHWSNLNRFPMNLPPSMGPGISNTTTSILKPTTPQFYDTARSEESYTEEDIDYLEKNLMGGPGEKTMHWHEDLHHHGVNLSELDLGRRDFKCCTTFTAASGALLHHFSLIIIFVMDLYHLSFHHTPQAAMEYKYGLTTILFLVLIQHLISSITVEPLTQLGLLVTVEVIFQIAVIGLLGHVRITFVTVATFCLMLSHWLMAVFYLSLIPCPSCLSRKKGETYI